MTVLAVAGLVMARRLWPTPRATSVQRSLRQFTYGAGLQQDPAWSPDGKRIAFASDRLGSLDIWVQGLGDAEPVRVTSSPSRDWQPNWSPDGRSLVFRSDRDGGGLFVMTLDGGEPHRVSDFGDHPQWSPTGELILFSNTTVRTGVRQLFVVEAAGGRAREICADALEPLISSAWVSSVDAAWYPDGRRVSVWGRLGGGWAFLTMPISGGEPIASFIPEATLRQIDEWHLNLSRFVWAHSRRFLYFEGQTGETRNVWRVGVDPSTLAWTGALERLTTDVGEETNIALSADGTRLAFTVRSQRTRVWSLGFDPAQGRLTGSAHGLTTGSAGRADVDTFSDGSRLAYRAVRSGRSEVREFRTSNNEERVLLASTEWTPSAPRWSADGSRLAYARQALAASGPVKSVVAVLSTDERREQLLTLPGEATLRPSDWAADGSTILGDCRSARGESTGICSIPARGGADLRLRVLVHDPTKNLFGPRFSPDQRWMSFVAVDVKGSTPARVYVAPVGGGPWIPISDGQSFDDKPRWAPDGRAVYFVSDRNGYLNLAGRRFDPAQGKPVGEAFPLTSFDSPRHGLPSSISQIEFAITRHHLFLPLTDSEGDIWVLDHVDR
jgi:Tol biopolymer transport system component